MQVINNINKALEITGFKHLINGDVQFLGEGAWNKAYLVSNSNEKWVIRFPKEEAYGEKVNFGLEKEISINEACKYYYEVSKSISPATCVSEFYYHINPEITCTIEPYMGKTLDLEETDLDLAEKYGFQVGEYYNLMHNYQPNIEGYGHLLWKDGKFEGENNQENLQESILAEQNILIQEIEDLPNSLFGINIIPIKKLVRDLVENRTTFKEHKTLVNIDAKPENIIINDGQVSMIDVYPYLHNGTTYAGYVTHLYQSLLPNYYDSPRYLNKNFKNHKEKLIAMGEGFIRGYTNFDKELRFKVRVEQFLFLLYEFHNHLQEINNPEPSIQTLNYLGDKKIIQERLGRLLYEIQNFDFK